jgi:diguanylate cyclase (GGDEF)-like protein
VTFAALTDRIRGSLRTAAEQLRIDWITRPFSARTIPDVKQKPNLPVPDAAEDSGVSPPHLHIPSWADRLLFGEDRFQRLRLQRTLMSMLVYVICLALIEYCTLQGMVAAATGRTMQAGMMIWMGIVFGVVRSGLNMRFADPSLTFLQIMAAGAWITLAYALFAPVRGALLMLLVLTLVFGIFNLNRLGRRIYNATALVGTGLTMYVMSRLRPDDYPPDVEWVHFVLMATILPVMSMLSGQLMGIRSRLRAQRNALEAALERIRQLATRDELTDLPNRRHAHELFMQLARQAERNGAPLTLCLLDLDHFKQINDNFGHGAGDEVLKRFSAIAGSALRESDVLARWGGEEFLVLLPDTDARQATTTMARVRLALAGVRLIAAPEGGSVTFSGGVAQFRPGESMEHALERADFALYRAKSDGRNRCVISD